MRRLSVMIVDDEVIVRNGVRDSIDWNLYGFEIIGLFDNAVKALNVLSETPADIIITDIRMPMMDGLQFAKKCREAGIESKFVILSGYDDFKYAQEAIRCGVEGYILKPIKEEELLEVLGTIRYRYFKDSCEENSDLKIDRSRYSKTTKNIIDYVNQNLANEELSLKWIADNVLFMNSGYLSKLFLKETGYKFSTFLLISRMEKAAHFLQQDGDMSVYEIAQNTGFGNNPQYFSTVFKKYYGKTPKEYAQAEGAAD
ncbi:MAG: response regulator [Hungatella hathewayi]|nr:response regulator [Hungatella hathewayi]